MATVAFWEINGKKKHTNAKVGQILTLEGGIGQSFMGGGVSVGMAYCVEWKITKDQDADHFNLWSIPDCSHARFGALL